ncbi:MAG: hypothetical protein U0263_12065 [Polyangiaceae bacterium]
MIRYPVLAIAFGVVLALASSCAGSNSDGSAPKSGTCEAAHRARCKRACECQPGPECAFAGGVIQDEGGTTVFGAAVVKSEDACFSLSVIECANGGDPNGDYPACESKSPTAACVEFQAEGNTYTGVEPLAECNFN